MINNTILCFSSITLIKKVISLFENPFISFTTAKMLLMNFMFQILLLLNSMSILVWFLTVNATTPAQILPKTSPRFSKHWNLNKISVKPHQDFCEILTRFLLLWWGTILNKILLRSILFLFSLASSNLALFSPTLSSCLFNSQILNHASLH